MTDNRLPDDWVVIADAGHGVEASMIEDRLRDDGIEVAVLEASGAPGAWLTGAEPYWAPKSIAVHESNEERALQLLAHLPDAAEEADPEDPALYEDVDDEPEASQQVQPFDTGGPAVLANLRRAAWVLAALIVAGLLWTQCPGSA